MIRDKTGRGGSTQEGSSAARALYGKDVLAFHAEEQLSFDDDRLVELVVEHGETGAQAVIDDTLREIATLTAELVHCLRHDTARDAMVAATLCRKIEVAAHVAGLPLYKRVVADLKSCQERGDDNAAAAVLHRLVRLAATAMRQSWDICDHWA